MKILIIGAGALGGYFGARAIENGADVTFLLRERRARQIAQTGLVIESPLGNLTIEKPQWVDKSALTQDYDAIIVGCKAYDLHETMDAFAPAVGPETMIVPMLNGMAHLDVLIERFGESHVLGGYCLISAALNAEGHVQHFNPMHKLIFGERDGSLSERVKRLHAAFEGANCDVRVSERIVGEMWEKWVQIATLAGMTCLMRGAIGDIVAAGGAPLSLALLEEHLSVARAAGGDITPQAEARIRGVVSDPTSRITASMMKDLERGGKIEAQQLIGDMIRRREAAGLVRDGGVSMLDIVHAHLRTFEIRRDKSEL